MDTPVFDVKAVTPRTFRIEQTLTTPVGANFNEWLPYVKRKLANDLSDVILSPGDHPEFFRVEEGLASGTVRIDGAIVVMTIKECRREMERSFAKGMSYQSERMGRGPIGAA